jgi:hypothetical protein
VGGCTAGFTRLIGWFLFVVSSMANGRWEEGTALTMVPSSIPQFFSFPVFFFFFFVSGGSINKGCNFPPMKRQVVLRGGVQQKSASQKNQKKITKNTKLREKIKEINLKTRKITLPDPETFFFFFSLTAAAWHICLPPC